MSQVAPNFKFSGAPPRLLGELTAFLKNPTSALGRSGLGLRPLAVSSGVPREFRGSNPPPPLTWQKNFVVPEMR